MSDRDALGRYTPDHAASWPERDEDGLTLKRARFVREWLIDGNGTRAAITAGYSEATAQQIAAELLTFPVVQKKIAEVEAEHLRAIDLSAEKIALAHWEDHLRAVDDGRTSESTAALNGVLKARSIGGTNVNNNHSGTVNMDWSPETLAALREMREAEQSDADA